MGHVGLTPQSATKLGGFRAQGRTADAALTLYDDALALQEAGCFAIVLEAVPAPVAAPDHRGARRSRRSASAPARRATGRCSSGTTCSACTPGRTPRFVKRYAELADEIGDALDALRRRRPQRRVPGGAAHVLDPRRASSTAFEAALGRARLERSAANDRSAARRAAPSAAAPARAHVQPWTARTPITSRPTDQSRNASVEQPRTPRRRVPGVGAAAAEDVVAVERELDRPEHERERDRHRREREHVPRAAVGALRAERLRAAVQRAAEQRSRRSRRRARRRGTSRRRRAARRSRGRPSGAPAVAVESTDAIPASQHDQRAPARRGRRPPRRVVAQRAKTARGALEDEHERSHQSRTGEPRRRAAYGRGVMFVTISPLWQRYCDLAEADRRAVRRGGLPVAADRVVCG